MLQVLPLVERNKPVVVNYCDFTCFWDWENFKSFAAETAAVGIIPAYKGFHPHTLGTTNYAYLREQDGWAKDIQEKQPYTDNRMEEYASSGTYYFATGELMLEAFTATVAQGLSLNGEYYVSLTYHALFQKKLPVAVYPLQHFMQWGTPGDVAEYNEWSTIFKRLLQNDLEQERSGYLVVPMAGLGQRFSREGYRLTKPLIPVSGRPMVLQATHDLPPARQASYVLRADMPELDSISMQLQAEYPSALITTVPAVTEGQACTALIGLNELAKQLGEETLEQVTFGACDNGALYNQQAFQALANDPDVDVIVWGVRQHANAVRHPHMYGWINAVDNDVKAISVKFPLEQPELDPIVIGTFTFRRSSDFVHAVKSLISRDGRVNGEFYIDSCINDALALGLKCKLFEVDNFISWGTPNDLKTFEYWQSCFHKWTGHPYQLEQDSRVSRTAIAELQERYAALVPAPLMAKA
ncbi:MULTISPECIES: hypothetical protein [Pseudomonas]|uniref:hypothetical protein n=1 Tax=Pseudomonas TaxID=286 RepID=UPI001C498645|nr:MULTISPECIES: hypothetical protein [Pseudomonas]